MKQKKNPSLAFLLSVPLQLRTYLLVTTKNFLTNHVLSMS